MGLFSYISGLSNGNIEIDEGNSEILDLQAIPDKDALRKNCDIDFIFEQYQNGNLVKWLRFHNCEREYIQIENIKASDKGVVCQKLAEILQMDKVCGQEYIKMLEDENAKLKLQVAELENKLKQTKIASTNKNMRKNLCIGDIVEFGRYYQDASGEKTTIEWQVLDIEEDRALLISKYALDVVAFNSYEENACRYRNIWAESSIRTWLNVSFYKTAFSGENVKHIVSANTENNIYDNVFLLSVREVSAYFSNENARKCMRTIYADNKFEHVSDYQRAFWWLRNGAQNSWGSAVCIVADGSFNTWMVERELLVRPALWIKL
ncbi:MAG: DUF6273 domain-containing protein [Phascolarctobacterium sp.]|nr:DUF6273 domain-containing protein [Phascolarctobacterium sp.]